MDENWSWLHIDITKVPHILTPKGIVNATDVDGDEGERDPEEVKRQEAIIVLLGATGECVIHGRHDHADLEADDQYGGDNFVLRRAVVPQEYVVGTTEGEEQEPANDVTPDVHCLVGPPKYTLDTHACGQDIPVARFNERIKLQVLWRLLVVE